MAQVESAGRTAPGKQRFGFMRCAISQIVCSFANNFAKLYREDSGGPNERSCRLLASLQLEHPSLQHGLLYSS